MTFAMHANILTMTKGEDLSNHTSWRPADVARQQCEQEIDPHDASLLETTLALTVDERLQRVIDFARFIRAGQQAMKDR
jgi:hypothetical protein